MILFVAQVTAESSHADHDLMFGDLEANFDKRLEELLPIGFECDRLARAPHGFALGSEFDLLSGIAAIRKHPNIDFVFDQPRIDATLDRRNAVSDDAVSKQPLFLPGREVED